MADLSRCETFEFEADPAQDKEVLLSCKEISEYISSSSDKKVNVLIDSCSDMNPKVVKALGLDAVLFKFFMDDGEHVDDFWQSMSPKEFYARMRKKERVQTSAVSPGEYLRIFIEHAEQGIPTVYLAFTRGLSSSVDNARVARDMLKEQYPDFELYVLDNLCPSGATGLLVLETMRMVNHGISAKDLVEWIKEARYFVRGYFTLENLDTLAAGGRIPPAAAALGSKLKINPELTYDLKGALSLRGIYHGRKKALLSLIEEYKKYALNNDEQKETVLPVAIVSSDAESDALWLAKKLRKEPVFAHTPIMFSSVDPSIGAHTGPGMVGLAFWGKDRREDLGFTDRLIRSVSSKKQKEST